MIRFGLGKQGHQQGGPDPAVHATPHKGPHPHLQSCRQHHLDQVRFSQVWDSFRIWGGGVGRAGALAPPLPRPQVCPWCGSPTRLGAPGARRALRPAGRVEWGGPGGEQAGAERACMLMSWAASLRTGAVAAGRAGAARQPERPPARASLAFPAPTPAPLPPETGPRPSAEYAGCSLLRRPRAAAALGDPGRPRGALSGRGWC